MRTEEVIRVLTRAAPDEENAPAVLPTGSVGLDILLGGGWRKGSVSELYGPPDCGTTTVALRTVAAVQQAYPDQAAVIYDSSPGSGSRLPAYAATLGADLDRLVIAANPGFLPARNTAITVVDGHSSSLLPPREDLGETVLVIPAKPGLARSAVSVRMQRSYGARWAWAELDMPGSRPVPVSLAWNAQLQEILQTAILYGLADVHGKRWYYCGPRKIAGGWHDAVRILQNDAKLRDKIINGIAEKTGLNSANWLDSPAFTR